MKLKFLALAMMLCGLSASAQNPYIAIEGIIVGEEGMSVSQPRTVLAVDVAVERDVTVCGPYARYAQKFLGVRAPLNDKTSYAITGASVALADASSLYATAPAATKKTVTTYAVSEDEFARIQPDKNDMTIPALEDAARTAAESIFSLRRHRTELITGEAGENVFGEGLEAALAQIAQQEQALLELFLGKHVLTTRTRRYMVYPKSDKKQYIVCRFSPAAGLLPESDLSGDLVMLQIEPSGDTSATVELTGKDPWAVSCRVADPSACVVISGGREYARAVLPVFEMGRTIKVASPRK